MNPLWILTAFIFGAVISRIGLPPLVGYLLAGFALNSTVLRGVKYLTP
jgi:predicted Kef-type K+ transport protein